LGSGASRVCSCEGALKQRGTTCDLIRDSAGQIHCNFNRSLHELTEVLKIAGGLHAIADSPISFEPKLWSYLPDSKIVLTVRDPEKWWASRVKNHAGDFVCVKELWDKVWSPLYPKFFHLVWS
jgi:hypothetical protein